MFVNNPTRHKTILFLTYEQERWDLVLNWASNPE